MTWTYGGDPSANTRDEVRFLIGDTDTTDQQVTDEEIAYLLTIYPAQTGYPNFRAAAAAASSLAAKYAKSARKSVGALSIDHGQKHQQYLALATDLEKKAASHTSRQMGVPTLGGGGDTFLMSDSDWTGSTGLD